MHGGFLPFVKPVGPSSNTCLQHLSRLTGERRLGHTGTLDPAADGVLVVVAGPATALIPYLPGDKAYRATARLGIVTATQDAQGRVLAERPVPELTRVDVETVLARFTGPIRQIPPAFSAVHHLGRRMYKLARKGTDVPLQPRPVVIHSLELLELSPLELVFTVRCSAGTYIRTLAAEIGEALGCGAHLARLTRTEANGFTLENAITLEELDSRLRAGQWPSLLMPPARALPHLAVFTADETQAAVVRHGGRLPASAEAREGTAVMIEDQRGELLAMARVRAGQLRPERVLCAAA